MLSIAALCSVSMVSAFMPYLNILTSVGFGRRGERLVDGSFWLYGNFHSSSLHSLAEVWLPRT